MHLLRPKDPAWTPVVLECSALDGTGVAELWAAAEAHRATLEGTGALADRRASQTRAWMWGEISAGLLERLRTQPKLAELATQLEADTVAGRVPPTVAADQILDAFVGADPRT